MVGELRGRGMGDFADVSQDIVDDIIFDIEDNGAHFGLRSVVQTLCWGHSPDISREDLTDYLVVCTVYRLCNLQSEAFDLPCSPSGKDLHSGSLRC